MKDFKELKINDLKISFEQLPEFKTTQEIPVYEKIIGQKIAEKSIDLGLKMNRKGYNIFISGHTGTGKTGYIVRKIEEYAKNQSSPNDWCYVYNFEDENTPMAIALKTGRGYEFKEDLSELVKYLLKEAPSYFNSQSYEKEKNNIMEKYEKDILKLSDELHQEAFVRGFNIKKSSSGEYMFIPIMNNKQLDVDGYSALSDKQKEAINILASELRLLAFEAIKNTKQLRKDLDEELNKMDSKIAEGIISEKICSLIKTYGDNEKIVKYLLALKKDIIENIYAFIQEDNKQKKSNDKSKLFFKRYDVNVFINNSTDKGAPVVFADSAEFSSLFGKIEYENKFENLTTDFTHIRPGSLQMANGGYLIIKAEQLIEQPLSWETLKRSLNLEMVSIGNSKRTMEFVPIITLNPESIPLRTKIILIGSNYLYSILLSYDQDFEKYFKIKAEFNDVIECEEKNILNIVGFFSNYIQKNNLLHISKDGVNELLKYSTRLVGKRNYLTSSMSKVLKIVDIADYFTKNDNCSIIDKSHILRAVAENQEMHNLIRKKVLDMYKSNKYVINLNGSKVGQINGLSVSDYGDCVVGQQHRITVTTYAGREGVINIERETNMSGNIHSKGIMILSGYIGELIGQEASISFNANIVFEQLYSGIEGDSASAAELLALLSRLSDIPLKQGFAITGSVNQKGEIQPIGGVNQKIEGYFDICSIFGLNGSHGVIIPNTNIDDLVLEDKVLNAIEKGDFRIYAASSIEQCFEILCDDEFKKSIKENIMNEVKRRILNKLREYNEILIKNKN